MITDFLIIVILLVALSLGLTYFPWIILALLLFIFLIVLLQGLIQIIASFLPLFQYKTANHTFDNFVSIHVPSFNEPTALLKTTLKNLSLLKYKNYEVIVIDNNTIDEFVWKPIGKYCSKLGSNFKFFHIDRLEGFKAGALNFALNETDSKAEFIAVIDADYQVKPQFLKEALSYFVDDDVAFIEFPQAYINTTAENRGIAVEYEHFFKSYLKMANHFNFVTCTGTLVIFRSKILKEIGFYDKNCLTEDAEIGTRLIEAGYRGIYIDKVMGQGLMPYDIEAYKKQKSRWAYGNTQVLKKDFSRILFGKKLNFKQKISFFSEMTAWFNFTLIPILVIFLGAFLVPAEYNNNFILKLAILIATLTIYCYLIMKSVSFVATFIEECTIINIIKALLVHFGMVLVYSTTFIKSLLNTNFYFERTNKFILPKKPNILKNTMIEIFMITLSFIVGLNYFASNNLFLAITTLVVTVNYLLVFYVHWEIASTKKYSAKLIGEMKKSFSENKISLR